MTQVVYIISQIKFVWEKQMNRIIRNGCRDFFGVLFKVSVNDQSNVASSQSKTAQRETQDRLS